MTCPYLKTAATARLCALSNRAHAGPATRVSTLKCILAVPWQTRPAWVPYWRLTHNNEASRATQSHLCISDLFNYPHISDVMRRRSTEIGWSSPDAEEGVSGREWINNHITWFHIGPHTRLNRILPFLSSNPAIAFSPLLVSLLDRLAIK